MNVGDLGSSDFPWSPQSFFSSTLLFLFNLDELFSYPFLITRAEPSCNFK